MLFNLSVLFLFSFSLLRLCLADDGGIQGDNFCGDLMCVTAFVNSSTITYQMTALNQLGWMAMGFGTQMADAKMVIMWPNSDGTVTLSQRTAPAGHVEPSPDPNPPRVATTYSPLTIMSPTAQILSFTVPKDNTESQNAIWALSVVNPMSDAPDASIQFHLDSGVFTLNLTGEINPDELPGANPTSTIAFPTGTSTPFPGQSQAATIDAQPFQTFEKLIIVHAVLSVTGFLVLLPVGSLIARWGRTVSENWFYYHWTTQVILSIPVVVVGWALGPLSVAVQGTTHANDAHKVLGILLFPLYLIQMSLGTFMHFRKPTYPIRHPRRNIVRGVLGILIVALAFYQVRTGLTTEWNMATLRTINLNIFSNIWIAWTVFIPVAYFSGFFLLRRQLKHEREMPPPYTPGAGSSEHEGSTGSGVRRLLGLDARSVDDGTHGAFSEDAAQEHGSSAGRTSTSAVSGGIEMREVPTDRWTPLSHAASPAATP